MRKIVLPLMAAAMALMPAAALADVCDDAAERMVEIQLEEWGQELDDAQREQMRWRQRATMRKILRSGYEDTCALFATLPERQLRQMVRDAGR